MNKIPRFMKEYAQFKEWSIRNNELIDADKEREAIKNINKTQKMYEKGLISVDEAMRMIMYCSE